MSNWLDKAKDFIKGHPDQAKEAVEKAEDLVNDKTGGKYAEQVDQASDALGEQLGLPPDAEDVPTAPAPAPAPAPTPPAEPPASEGAGPADPGEATGLPRDSVPEETADQSSPGDLTLDDPPATTR